MYDGSVSTLDFYASPESEFVGKFREFREMLDYSYHTNVIPERQLLQDRLVESLLDVKKKPPSDDAWIVFFGGVMGAGKSYLHNRLQDDAHSILHEEDGHAALDKFPPPLQDLITDSSNRVKIDLDALRESLPEWKILADRDRRAGGGLVEGHDFAGDLTQGEVSMIGEIATLAALSRCMNVIIDTSLRDKLWWMKEIERLRQVPHSSGYFCTKKVALLYLRSRSYGSVWERVLERGKLEGRFVDQHHFNASWEQAPKTFEALKPKVDFYAEFENDSRGKDPVVTQVGAND
jgi:hypothetical protein